MFRFFAAALLQNWQSGHSIWEGSLLQLSEVMKDSQDRVVRRDSPFDVIRKGFKRSSQGISSFKRSLSFKSLYHQTSLKKADLEEKIVDPQGPFMQRWNKIFLISCVFALACDPLFLYIPFIDTHKKCMKFDTTLKITVCALRTISDLFYLLHIIIQFRTGFISPSSRGIGRGDLIKDLVAVARRYLFSHFFVDVLAVLPLPQVAYIFVMPKLQGPLTSKRLLKLVVFSQYFPRLFRMYPLYKEVTRASGIITQTAWAGAAFNMCIYMLASHVVGASWYLFAIDRQSKCWHRSCTGLGCDHLSFYCEYDKEGSYTFNETYCSLIDPDEVLDSSVFNYGMFYDALSLKIVQSDKFSKKLLYCFWWGLRNLSSLGQNLKTSTFIGESLFAGFICVFGLFLFSSLIANMQKYLQSTTVRVEEMTLRRQDTEQWMSHRLLPDKLRERVRRYEQYKWQETRGVDEEIVIRDLPKDLRREIKRHLCLDLLKRVPMLEKMDEQLLDAMCERLKPVLFTENSYIVREGDPVNEMLFIMRGKLESMTTNGGRTGFFNSVFLEAGEFCGESLLTWGLDPCSSSNLPISTRTVLSKTEVEAFALLPDDMMFVASQFRRLHNSQLRHTFRFYSQQWRTWAACFIQVAWKRHRKRKIEKSLQGAEYRLRNVLAKEAGTPLSLGESVLLFTHQGLLLKH